MSASQNPEQVPVSENSETSSIIHHPSSMLRNQRGATALEYALLLAAIALPSALLFRWALELLLYQYRMMSMMISLPFP